MHGRVASRRSVPYPGAGCLVRVPRELWEASVDELGRYAGANSEALVFWGGVVCGKQVQVTGLYILGHAPQGGTVKVTPEETRWLLRELRRRDEKLIAQFHSHPGEAYHSAGDDSCATAFHEGLLSIVAPNFATGVMDPTECAVHEYRDGRFHLLSPEEVAQRIVLDCWTARRRSTPIPPKRIDRERLPWWTTIASSLRRKLTGRRRR